MSKTVQPDFREQAKANDAPVARLIGFQAKDIRDERATVTLSAGRQHANPMGTLHGGILCDIADAAMGMALASTLAPEESFTAVELKINYLRPVWQARLKGQKRRNNMYLIALGVALPASGLAIRACRASAWPFPERRSAMP
jgi:uncharacterized protein (TIGR00369 family)